MDETLACTISRNSTGQYQKVKMLILFSRHSTQIYIKYKCCYAGDLWRKPSYQQLVEFSVANRVAGTL